MKNKIGAILYPWFLTCRLLLANLNRYFLL